MKTDILPVQGDADDAANHNTRYARTRACTHNGGLGNLRHLRHRIIDFGGSRAHTYIEQLARTDTAILFLIILLYLLDLFPLLSSYFWGNYA